MKKALETLFESEIERFELKIGDIGRKNDPCNEHLRTELRLTSDPYNHSEVLIEMLVISDPRRCSRLQAADERGEGTVVVLIPMTVAEFTEFFE